MFVFVDALAVIQQHIRTKKKMFSPISTKCTKESISNTRTRFFVYINICCKCTGILVVFGSRKVQPYVINEVIESFNLPFTA